MTSRAAKRPRQLSPWIVGDWTRVVRDPTDVLRATFLAGATVTAVNGDTESAVRFLLTFVVVVGVRMLALPRLFDFGFVLGMMFQAWGNALDVFIDYPGYDKVVHFVLPFFTAPLVYILLARLGVVPDLEERNGNRRNVGLVIMSLSFGITIGAVYEIYEWFADNALGANLHVGYDDTIGDLADDALGALGGGVLLLVWETRGWATTRRLPARVLRPKRHA